jgi:hypothetical protein
MSFARIARRHRAERAREYRAKVHEGIYPEPRQKLAAEPREQFDGYAAGLRSGQDELIVPLVLRLIGR